MGNIENFGFREISNFGFDGLKLRNTRKRAISFSPHKSHSKADIKKISTMVRVFINFIFENFEKTLKQPMRKHKEINSRAEVRKSVD